MAHPSTYAVLEEKLRTDRMAGTNKYFPVLTENKNACIVSLRDSYRTAANMVADIEAIKLAIKASRANPEATSDLTESEIRALARYATYRFDELRNLAFQ